MDKRNLALKHKIVHHNKKEAEKAEETLRTEAAELKRFSTVRNFERSVFAVSAIFSSTERV